MDDPTTHEFDNEAEIVDFLTQLKRPNGAKSAADHFPRVHPGFRDFYIKTAKQQGLPI